VIEWLVYLAGGRKTKQIDASLVKSNPPKMKFIEDIGILRDADQEGIAAEEHYRFETGLKCFKQIIEQKRDLGAWYGMMEFQILEPYLKLKESVYINSVRNSNYFESNRVKIR
jgi:hypothetical protein